MFSHCCHFPRLLSALSHPGHRQEGRMDCLRPVFAECQAMQQLSVFDAVRCGGCLSVKGTQSVAWPCSPEAVYLRLPRGVSGPAPLLSHTPTATSRQRSWSRRSRAQDCHLLRIATSTEWWWWGPCRHTQIPSAFFMLKSVDTYMVM